MSPNKVLRNGDKRRSRPQGLALLEPIQEVVESDESVVILCWRLISRGGAQ
jgi:hypothetical protein